MKTSLCHFFVILCLVFQNKSFAHDNETIHPAISRSAAYSSPDAFKFAADYFDTAPGDSVLKVFIGGRLAFGAFEEDAPDTRVVQHFFDPTKNPPAGLSDVGLDDLEMRFPFDSSFKWASESYKSSLNDDSFSWPDSRKFEFESLTNGSKAERIEKLGKAFEYLGHVIHLNQDLSQPDHVRNDNHLRANYRHVENFGRDNWSNNKQWFNPKPRGWAYWQNYGFQKLRDFWDRDLYEGSDDARRTALNAEAAETLKLGLAEFCNGNFISPDATYAEMKVGTTHFFPFPSLESSTDYRAAASIGNGVIVSHLKNGKPINVYNVKKIADGITVNNHSRLLYLGRGVSGRGSGPSLAFVSSTINDPVVLQNYHDILIPKAVEYSAGILDYFFRGRLNVCVAGDDQLGWVVTAQNISGETFGGGKFVVLLEDSSGTRTNFLESALAGTLSDGDSVSFSIPASVPTGTKCLVVYQGTIGLNGYIPKDPVDTGIAIAADSTILTPPPSENTLTWTVTPVTYDGSPTISGTASGPAGSYANSGSFVDGYCAGDLDFETEVANYSCSDVTLQIATTNTYHVDITVNDDRGGDVIVSVFSDNPWQLPYLEGFLIPIGLYDYEDASGTNETAILNFPIPAGSKTQVRFTIRGGGGSGGPIDAAGNNGNYSITGTFGARFVP